MEITILHSIAPIPIAILHLQGVLDDSAREGLIEEARRQQRSGFNNLLLDFRFVTSVESAGLSVLQEVAQLFSEVVPARQGRAVPSLFSKGLADGYHAHVKLVNVPVKIQQAFEQAGGSTYFESFTDLREAIASFH